MRMRRPGRSLSTRRGQELTEAIILVAIVGLSLAWVTMALPRAITKHYTMNVRVLAAPF